ncbi:MULTISPECIES: hypothetical protein [unclassified Snodgrassella]|uniref:hypothetical protein n=1 Tax=unclassified Snodgrassella TaxID=2625236 RepID=UPI0018DD8A86|nr:MULTISPECIES: hypothetical protein [unclassified Snodgrassella]MBI0068848.1 hypothetical protein [Snodgrassella sp. M0110]MBI0077415.1 hypothetical protein [Snodgrassella sp. M0118]MBI0079782.1 hypothetical protein [Snodgrassella sp. M0112]
MLNNSGLNSTVLATEHMSKNEPVELLALAQTVESRQESGMLLDLAQTVISVQELETRLDLAQTVNSVVDSILLDLAQTVIGNADFAPMHGSQSIGMEGLNYAVKVYINGDELDPCRMLRSCEISYSEGESAKATLYLKEDCGQVDMYLYYNQLITIYAQNEKYTYPLFTGIVDIPDIDFMKRTRTITASNDRSNAVEKLGADTVRKIGYWCESVFGELDQYDSLNAELTDRLSTIPASFDFDPRGQAVLTPWKPKTKPDWVLSNCDCYYRQFNFRLGGATSLINQVEIEVHHQFDRLFHRENYYSYNYCGFQSDIDYVVNVRHEGPPPKFDDIYSAASSGGWLVGNFQTKGTPPSGWYGTIYFSAADYEYDYQPTGSKDANGNPIVNVVQVAKTKAKGDLYAMWANWRAMRRWKQAVDEKYPIVIKNTASIRLHGVKSEKLSYTIKHDADKSKLARNWGNEKKYFLPKGERQPNGDYTINVDEVIPNEFARAMQVIYQAAYTKILESHRHNELSLIAKFAPAITLDNTIFVDTDKFTGNVKVKSYTHKFNFLSLLGETELTGACYVNPLSNSSKLTAFPNPPSRPELPLASYKPYIKLNDYVVPYGQQIIENDPDEDINPEDREEEKPQDPNHSEIIIGSTPFRLYECQGYVRIETGYYYHDKKVKRGYAFRIQTPDIEEASTDTAEVDAGETSIEVDVPDGNIDVFMRCY